MEVRKNIKEEMPRSWIVNEAGIAGSLWRLGVSEQGTVSRGTASIKVRRYGTASHVRKLEVMWRADYEKKAYEN
jgi:hypothetical protein